jgi:hypothetical protein
MNLDPDQIITLNDYPLYDMDSYRRYELMIRSGEVLPLVPVIPCEFVRFEGAIAQLFEEFSRSHPRARFFMVDGSHRTTALTLANKPIKVIVFRSDDNIRSARAMLASGRTRPNTSLDLSFEQNVDELIEHFEHERRFMTVREKSERLVHDGFVVV